MFFSISFEPIDGKVDRISRSLLDNVIDQRFNEDIDLGADELLDFSFLLFHFIIIEKYNHQQT